MPFKNQGQRKAFFAGLKSKVGAPSVAAQPMQMAPKKIKLPKPAKLLDDSAEQVVKPKKLKFSKLKLKIKG